MTDQPPQETQPPPFEYQKWLHDVVRQHAHRAHDANRQFQVNVNQATIKGGDAALRAALLINGGAAVSVLAFIGGLVSQRRIELNQLAITPGQEQLECFLAGPVCHGHRFKIHRRKSDGAGSASTVNLPAPRLGGIGPLLYDKGIIIRLKTSGHAGNMRLRVTCRQRNQTHSFRGTLSN